MMRLLILLLLCLCESYRTQDETDFLDFPPSCMKLKVEYTFVVAIYRTSPEFRNDDEWTYIEQNYTGLGTLLNGYWVLTANTNFLLPDFTFRVLAGAHTQWNWDKPKGIVREYYLSPYSSKPGQWNMGIALLELQLPIHTSDRISYVSLATYYPYNGEKVEDICRDAVIMGYSNAAFGDWDILTCREVEVPPESHCQRSELPDNASCFSGFLEDCYFYRGGPLMCNGSQYGVISSVSCDAKDHKNKEIFTKVHMHEDFIRSTMLANKRQGQAPMIENLSTSNLKFLNLLIFLPNFALCLIIFYS